MPVTPDQGRMLATLAVACRPHGAPRWDEAGTLAAIKRIASWNLAMAIDNVVKHAVDPKAMTPGVIGGSFTPPDLVRPTPTPPKRADQCRRCGGVSPCACTRESLAYDHTTTPEPHREQIADTAVAAALARQALVDAAVALCSCKIRRETCPEHRTETP